MAAMARYDLHTHSTESDGTEPPADVVRAAARAGLDGLALTDHDTTAGWAEAAHAARETGLTLVPGMEMSCTSADGVSVHVLSYLHDPEDPALLREVGLARDARLIRAQEMVRRLGADFPITWELVQEHAAENATIGRPHLADALVTIGAVPDRSAAFREILAGRSKYYVPHFAPDPAEAVALIRAAGGVPVFAHPRARMRGRVVGDEVFEQMAEAGLAGVEVEHEPVRVRRLPVGAEAPLRGVQFQRGNLRQPGERCRLLDQRVVVGGGFVLDLAGGDLGVDQIGVAGLYLAIDADTPFGAHGFSQTESRRIRIDHALRHAVVIAQIDKQHPAMISDPVDPAGKTDGLAFVGQTQITASMATVGMHSRSSILVQMCSAPQTANRNVETQKTITARGTQAVRAAQAMPSAECQGNGKR